jgi:dienelactone hydrolase
MKRRFQFSSLISRHGWSLRGAAACTTVVLASTLSGSGLAATEPIRLQLTLPAPTGAHDIGTISLHLVDKARQDPWWSTSHPRELMVNVWYPAGPAAGHWELAPWTPSAALAYYRAELIDFIQHDPGVVNPPPPGGTPPPPPDVTPVEVSLDGVAFPISHAREGAPVEIPPRQYPVVLFAPGYGHCREHGTTLVEDLASRGYVVVTMSYTYETAEVEFPGGRVELGRHEPGNDLTADPLVAVAIRKADTQFVLNKLVELAGGLNPDAEQRVLPAGLRGCMDLSRIGMFGHSIGGATTASMMANDSRIIAGINLDGTIFPENVSPITGTPEQVDAGLALLATRIGDHPFMIMGDSGRGPYEVGSTNTFYYNLGGWRRYVSLVGSTHGSYTDDEALLNELAAGGAIQKVGGGAVSAARWVGTIDPNRAIAAERAYIGAFFDLWLRNSDNHLLDGPSAEFPEAKLF